MDKARDPQVPTRFLPVIRGNSLASTSCSEMDAISEASFRLADAHLASESNNARTRQFLRSGCLAGGGALAAPTYGVHRVLPKRQIWYALGNRCCPQFDERGCSTPRDTANLECGGAEGLYYDLGNVGPEPITEWPEAELGRIRNYPRAL